MSVVPERGPLTEALLAALRDRGVVVGDGELPDASWVGEPNLPGSEYEPFAVLSELIADRSDGPIGASQGDWRMPYLIELFGVSREQVTAIADRSRGFAEPLRFATFVLGTATYKVQLVRHDNIGQPSAIQVTEPPFWHQQDGITIWIGKEIT